MCELMGLSFARPISADFSIREFALAGEENADGWGLAWYPDRSLAVVKEPIEWRTSKYTGFLETYSRLLSAIYIAHVRHKTVGGAPTHADTHPFSREMGGREYCFAHNGTLGRLARFPLGRFQPIGATDSEHAFCHLLGQLERRVEQEGPSATASGPLANVAAWKWLYASLAELNGDGKLNCLFSDGKRLFCYHDARGYKGLCVRKISVRSHQARHFSDETIEIDLEDESVNHGYVVATRPLSAAGWERFAPGELIVFEAGILRFSSNAGRMADV